MQESAVMKNNYQEMRTLWDKIGFSLSGLCLIHCLLLPLFVASLPWLGKVVDDERVHLLFAAVTVPVALIAFIPGYFRHRHASILVLGMLGALGLLLGSVGHDLVGHKLAHPFTILGGFFLVIAHIRNLRAAPVCCAGESCQKS